MRKGVDELLELGRDLQGSAVAHGDDVIGGGEAPAERGAIWPEPPVRRTTLRSGAEGFMTFSADAQVFGEDVLASHNDRWRIQAAGRQ